MGRIILFTLAFIIIVTSAITAGAGFTSKKFDADYKALKQEPMINKGEVAEISNFVYKKDVATFEFIEGHILLQRYVDDRPTLALFVGKGKVTIDIPSNTESLALESITGYRAISEDIEVCLIRMADDLDLRLREQFEFKNGAMLRKKFKMAKKAQVEFFFNPNLRHLRDNYFQLLRSAYQRAADGYFFADFNDYTFCFDPSLVEEVELGFQFSQSDQRTSIAVRMQRAEANAYEDNKIFKVTYPIVPLKGHASIDLAGTGGNRIDFGKGSLTLVIQRDSTKYLSTYLAADIVLDSVLMNDKLISFKRRKDFTFAGLILPKYSQPGDTITIDFCFHSKTGGYPLPWVECTVPQVHSFSIRGDKGAVVPIDGEISRTLLEDGREQVEYELPIKTVSGDFARWIERPDTATLVSPNGFKVKFIGKEVNDRKWLKAEFKKTIGRAYDFMTATFGNIHNLKESWVRRKSGFQLGSFGFIAAAKLNEFTKGQSYKRLAGVGWIEVPANNAHEEIGGFHRFAGRAVAEQWFYGSSRLASKRDFWIKDALTTYMALLFIKDDLGAKQYYNNLTAQGRFTTSSRRKKSRGIPIAANKRYSEASLAAKGAWLFHMLRIMMHDIGQQSDETFLNFVKELILMAHLRTFDTRDFIKMAEEHYGSSLSWFFNQWLFGNDYPEYDVEYTILQQGEAYVIDFNVKTKGISPNFVMPVVIRVDFEAGSAYVRQPVGLTEYKFQLGPYDQKPTGAFFNEFFSVMAKVNQKQK